MPVYEYAGVTSAGKKTRGVQDAESPRALRDLLKSRGVFVTDVSEGGKDKAARPAKPGSRRAGKAEKKAGGTAIEVQMPWEGRISMMEISIFTRQLATLQKAGIPLVECLQALVEQTENEALRKIVAEVRQKVNEGAPLAVAMSEHPKAFSDLYVHMIRAGESAGNLDVVLLRLTEFLDEQLELRNKLVSAAVYPLLMMVLGFAIVTYLMVSVIPKVTAIFADQGESLPFVTNVLIWTSHTIGRWWWLMGGLAFGASVLFRKWRATQAGREKWDRFVLKTPVFGDLTRLIAISRFSKTLATLLGSGVSLLNAMDIVKNILGNTVLIQVIEQARLNIREGESIARPLKRSGEFPPMVTHMIAVGERTGELENMLGNVAEAYDRQVTTRVQALTNLLEPMMIVIMGGGVGFIVFAILLPILKMNEAFT